MPTCLLFVSVSAVSGDEVYSLVYHTQQELEPAAGETWKGMNVFLAFDCPEQSVALLGNVAAFFLRADCGYLKTDLCSGSWVR